jgi:hypothetical protein
MRKLPLDIAAMMGCFVLAWTGRNTGWNLPGFVQSYLADLCCMPVLLYIALQVLRLIRRENTYQLKLAPMIFAWIWVSLLSEGVIPLLTQRYTADWWDVCVFAIGTWYAFAAQTSWPAFFSANQTVEA